MRRIVPLAGGLASTWTRVAAAFATIAAASLVSAVAAVSQNNLVASEVSANSPEHKSLGPTQDDPFPDCSGSDMRGCPGVRNCTLNTINMNIDHFGLAAPLNNHRHTTFKLRYYTNDQYWAKNHDGSRGPILYFFGGDSDIELDVNYAGFMWETAVQIKALLVFTEHRYYGQSTPFADGTQGCMNWLTTEQAMADHAYVIDHIRTTMNAAQSPIIGVGGGYGGMVAAWMRVHYPNTVDGVLASSAPIWSFDRLSPAYDPNGFSKIVTNDAGTSGGGTDSCRQQVAKVWQKIMDYGNNETGRATLATHFHTCSPLRPPSKDVDDAYALVQWAESAWGQLAIANYPYPSSYALDGAASLPLFPLRAACLALKEQLRTDEELFDAIFSAAAMWYNATNDLSCVNLTDQNFPLPPSPLHDQLARRSRMSVAASLKISGQSDQDSCRGSFGYQWCSELVQPFTQGTDADMFYCYAGEGKCDNWDQKSQTAACQQVWGLTPRSEWVSVVLGGNRINQTSNILFTNGEQDPWTAGGVTKNITSTIVAVSIPDGAHHYDLMFSDSLFDTQEIGGIRDLARDHIQSWIHAAHAAKIDYALQDEL